MYIWRLPLRNHFSHLLGTIQVVLEVLSKVLSRKLHIPWLLPETYVAAWVPKKDWQKKRHTVICRLTLKCLRWTLKIDSQKRTSLGLGPLMLFVVPLTFQNVPKCDILGSMIHVDFQGVHGQLSWCVLHDSLTLRVPVVLGIPSLYWGGEEDSFRTNQ